MVSIDLIFLTVLINAVTGSIYMKMWTWYSGRLESKSDYGRIYLLLRTAIILFSAALVWIAGAAWHFVFRG